MSRVPFYKRYVDDGAGTAKNKETAIAILNSIAEQDEEKKAC